MGVSLLDGLLQMFDLLEWKVYDAIYDVSFTAGCGYYFQILHALPNRDSLLMRVNDTSKGDAGPLAMCRFGEQVIVLGKEDSS